MLAWKDSGPVPEKVRNSTYQQFKEACDFFFEQKRAQSKVNEGAYVVNLEKKKAVCDKIEALAKAGSNDRIWNALQKHALADPANFASYYSNDTIALASEAWLGTGYWVTAQVNRVNPGGAAQSAHRDYHLGFMSRDQITQYPMHVHSLSPVLTLQGAIAHCDMPLETGPTLYLPYSQHFREGYLAFNRDEFQNYFSKHRSQLALKKLWFWL